MRNVAQAILAAAVLVCALACPRCAATPLPPHYREITKAALVYYEDDTAHNRATAKHALALYGASGFIAVQQTLNPKWEKAEAVAFVLADFGVDVCANVKRLSANWGSPQHGFAEEQVDNVVQGLYDIFLHTGRACAWLTFLGIPCDGEVCDTMVPDAVEAVADCPLHALAIAGQTRASAADLGDIVSGGPMHTTDRMCRAVLVALNRYSKSGNPHVRLAVRMCVVFIHEYAGEAGASLPKWPRLRTQLTRLRRRRP